MTDHSQEYRFYRYGVEADRRFDRLKGYLATRRLSDWLFFLSGVVIGAILF
jgi:hypothetical protein